MKRIVFTAGLLIGAFNAATAQGQTPDTMLSVTLDNTNINSSRITQYDMREYALLLHNVQKVMPYVNKISEMYKDATTRFGDDGRNVRAKRQYMNRQEAELKAAYKDKMKNLTIDQGRLLNKLISRQTGVTTYRLLKEYENGFTAFKWNAISSLYSYDLKRMYDPSDNRMLESIMTKLGYPLSDFYYSHTER